MVPRFVPRGSDKELMGVATNFHCTVLISRNIYIYILYTQLIFVHIFLIYIYI